MFTGTVHVQVKVHFRRDISGTADLVLLVAFKRTALSKVAKLWTADPSTFAVVITKKCCQI